MLLSIGFSIITPISGAKGLMEEIYCTDGLYQKEEAPISLNKIDQLNSNNQVSGNQISKLSKNPSPTGSGTYPAPTIFFENAEFVFPGTTWIVSDTNSNNGSDYWDDSSYRSKSGFWSIYCAGIGDTGSSHRYDNNMSAWMYLNTFNASNFLSMNISFDIWYNTEPNYDGMGVIATNDSGSNWYFISEIYNGSSGGWVFKKVSVPQSFFTSQFSIGFFFYSDDSISNYEGVYIDNINITGIAYENWTVIVYLAADSNLAASMLNDFYNMQRANSITNFQVVVLYDGDEVGDCGVAHFVEDFLEIINLTDINSTWGSELNTGDPNTLIDFAKYAIATHPSKRIFLSLEDHGGSFKGCCWDLTTDPSWNECLTLDELNYSFSEIKKFNNNYKLEIIQYYACLMGAMEVYYQTYPYSNYSIASEIVTYDEVWNYTRIFNHLENNSFINGETFAKFIVSDSISNFNPGLSVTMSAINNSNMTGLINTLNNFAVSLNNSLLNYYPYIYRDRNQTEWYDGPSGGEMEQIIDLYHFAQKINQDGILPASLKNSAQTLLNAINNAVIAEAHRTGSYSGQESITNAHGITIYLPGDYDYSDYYWYDYINDFSRNSKWTEFLYWFIYLSEWDLYEYDDFYTDATPILTNKECQRHNLNTSTNPDWIKFDAIQGYEYTIETSNLTFNTDTKIILYESDGITFIAFDDNSGSGFASQIIWDCLATRTYLLKIEPVGSGYGPLCWYDISIGNASPKLYVSTNEIDFSYMNNVDIDTKSFFIQNSNAGCLHWNFSNSYSWIYLDPSEGSNTDNIINIQVTIYTNLLSEGFHSGILTVNSNVDSAIIYVNVTIDATPPSLTIISPQNNSWIDEKNIFVEWSSDDSGCGVDHYEIQLDGGSWIDKEITKQHAFSGLSDSGHIINVTSCDKVSNVYQSSIYVNVDTTPPTLKITNPDNNIYLDSNYAIINWEGNDIGSGIDYYEILLDNENWIKTQFDEAHKFEDLSEGNHFVKLRIFDKMGFSVEKQVSFYIDTIAPTLNLISPNNNTWIKKTELDVIWDYSDDVSGVAKVVLELNQVKVFDVGISKSYKLTDLAEGTHNLKIIVYDGVLHTSHHQITFFVDITPPEVSIIKPNNNEYFRSDIDVKFTGIDSGSGIDYYNIKLDGMNYLIDYKKTNFNLKNLNDGKHTVEIIVMDLVGHSDTASISFYVDITKPTISFIEPQNGSTIKGSKVECRWSGTDEGIGVAYFEIKLDNKNYINVSYETNYTFFDVANGTHKLYLRTFDGVGNENEISITIIVDIYEDEKNDTDKEGGDKEEEKDESGSLVALVGGVIGIVVVIIIIILLFLFLKKKKPVELPPSEPYASEGSGYRRRPEPVLVPEIEKDSPFKPRNRLR